MSDVEQEASSTSSAQTKPKRPMNAYMLYLGENRARVKAANPSSSVGELTKLLAEEYKTIDEAAKKVLTDKVAAAKIRYEEEVKKFEAEGGSMKNIPKKKKEKDTPVKAKRAKKEKGNDEGAKKDNDEGAKKDNDEGGAKKEEKRQNSLAC
eukprot:TRINITY_DN2448_c0_g1_i1.p1 TRINITY_DN2448_c0_g1~~TRINITY_DN2448_c0_g1_i1.p1  ORF type:complete len:151 (+),score=60.41 TRINITY_DN2448_c0_g1_i1:273-725(+)